MIKNELSYSAKVEVCRANFYTMLTDAVSKSGGSVPVNQMKLWTLDEVVMHLAHNGIRMVYLPERHMNSVEIAWVAK